MTLEPSPYYAGLRQTEISFGSVIDAVSAVCSKVHRRKLTHFDGAGLVGKGNRREMRSKMTTARLIALLLLAGGLLAAAWFGLRGRGLRVRALNFARAVWDSQGSEPTDNWHNIIFLHHSVGRNLIREGEVRPALTEASLKFWDHDYNSEGLTRPDGNRAGYSYGIPNNNTNPDGLAQLFTQRLYPLPLNAWSGLMQHDVIIVKSCFPVSHIISEAQLATVHANYLTMRGVMDQHRDKLFIIVTQPPLSPAATSREAAARARALSTWLISDDFLAGHPNLFVFDLFDRLAEGDPAAPDANMLREGYREGEDSHPNVEANERIGPELAEFIIETVETYRER